MREEEDIMVKTLLIALLTAALVVFASGIASATGQMDRTGTIVNPATMNYSGNGALASADGMMDHTGTIVHPSMMNYSGTTTFALADGTMDRTGSIVQPSLMNVSGTATFALADGMMDRTGSIVNPATMNYSGNSALALADGTMDRTGSIVHPSLMNVSGTTTLALADGDMDRTGSIIHPSMMRHAMFHESQSFHKLLGAEVANNSGHKLGIVDDLIAGADGKLSYVVVSRNKTQGIGRELVAVPVDDVPMSVSGGNKCILDISRAAFDRAPACAISQRPLLARGQWRSEARGYFSNLGRTSHQATEPGRPSGQQEHGGY
jgi:sporulation protein YlmC with PRC-barrel domain